MLSFVKTKFGLLLLSSIISAVLIVGAFEIVKTLQYYRWKANYNKFGRLTIPSSNPVLMWEYRPYAQIQWCKTNRYGFRGRDYKSTAKPDNSFRIAFAGDSVTFGMGVNLEKTFVRQFEVEANQMESQYEIQALNFAVDGYNTSQILEMVRTKVLNFLPDKVVYVMCLNDFDFDDSSGKKILYFRKPKSFFLTMIKKANRRLHGGDYYQYHFSKNKNVVFPNILDMREIIERSGSSFQVVIVPIFPAPPATFNNYPLLDMHEEIGMFLKENGIRSLDLYEAFAESGELPGYYSSDVWHPNAKGSRLIAGQLISSVLLD
jgi:lysophospholipase L1-like esterase